MALTVNPNLIEKLCDLGQIGMTLSFDYRETLYTAEFGDGAVAYAMVGVGYGLRTYKLTWQQTYGFAEPLLLKPLRWDGADIEGDGRQSRPTYFARFCYRMCANLNACWIKDPFDNNYRLFRLLNLNPTFQQGDKFDRWGYGEEFRQIRAKFSVAPVNPALIAPEYFPTP